MYLGISDSNEVLIGCLQLSRSGETKGPGSTNANKVQKSLAAAPLLDGEITKGLGEGVYLVFEGVQLRSQLVFDFLAVCLNAG